MRVVVAGTSVCCNRGMGPTPHILVVLAGIGQLLLCAASLAIPRVLRWEDDLRSVNPLTRQVFWVYALYIWGTNLAFGLVSTFAADALLSGTPLATFVCGFMGLYWLVRVAAQFCWFDMSSAPSGAHVKTASVLLSTLFIYLTVVYGWITLSAWF